MSKIWFALMMALLLSSAAKGESPGQRVRMADSSDVGALHGEVKEARAFSGWQHRTVRRATLPRGRRR